MKGFTLPLEILISLLRLKQLIHDKLHNFGNVCSIEVIHIKLSFNLNKVQYLLPYLCS